MRDRELDPVETKIVLDYIRGKCFNHPNGWCHRCGHQSMCYSICKMVINFEQTLADIGLCTHIPSMIEQIGTLLRGKII